MKNLSIALVVVALIAIGAYFYPQGSALLGDATNFDAIGTEQLKVGTDCNEFSLYSSCQGFSVLANGAVTQGGQSCTLTDATGGAYTLSATELANCSYLKFAAGGAGQEVIALTQPASSTLSTFLPNAGQCRSYTYDATALAAGTTTTMTAGTGWNVIAYTANDDVIDGNEYSSWTICRQPTSDFYWKVSEDVNAD